MVIGSFPGSGLSSTELKEVGESRQVMTRRSRHRRGGTAARLTQRSAFEPLSRVERQDTAVHHTSGCMFGRWADSGGLELTSDLRHSVAWDS